MLSWEKHDERTEHPSIPKSCRNSYDDHYFVPSSQSTIDKSGIGRGFSLLLVLVGNSEGFRFCSFFTAFCGMEHSSLLRVSWDFIDFSFPCYVGKVAYWLLGNNSSFWAFIVGFKFVKEVKKVLWLMSSKIDVVKCSMTKHLWA